MPYASPLRIRTQKTSAAAAAKNPLHRSRVGERCRGCEAGGTALAWG